MPSADKIQPENDESGGAAGAAARLEQAHRICPGCGAEMVDRGCKLRCPRCGFFLDCSDG